MGIIDWLEQHELPCPNKYLFGMDCPGCGMQRAMLELLRGNFLSSLKLYPGLLPVIFTLVFLAFHLKYRYKNGARVLRYSYIFAVAVIMISFGIKQFYHIHS